MQEIKFIKSENLKAKPQDQSKLGFGKIFTDYMFTMEYNPKEGWHNPTVRPYENLSFDPATTTEQVDDLVDALCAAQKELFTTLS